MALADQIRLPTLNLIHRRPRLLDALDNYVEEQYRLITVYAPSGYGKSIILADFAQTTDLPVCWCSLVPANRDPTSFLSLLAYSITDRFHEIPPDQLNQVIERGETQDSIRCIADALGGVGEHILIIDDYHKAVSAGITFALNRLLELLPDTSTVIIAARGNMGLDTGQIIDLLISERATGLSEEELRFTDKEIQRVMRKRFGRRIDLESAKAIAAVTEGNIAQILLSGHMQTAQAGQMLISLRERLGDDRSMIYGYLADEVFGKQPLDLQKFMLQTAVLPDMTTELCNALLDISTAQTCLEALVHRDLFITQSGAGFKYHDLFAEFLRAKLAEDEAEHHQVTLKAAHLLANHARIEDAMNLFLSSTAWEEAARLLEQHWQSFYATGRGLTLEHWLAQIPELILEQYPQLLLSQGKLMSSLAGNPKKAMALLQKAEKQFHNQNDLIGVATAQVASATVLRLMGRATDCLMLASTALQQLETLQASDQMIADALLCRGNAHWTAGNIAEALVDLKRVLERYQSLNDLTGIGVCHQDIGTCLEKQGRPSAAIESYKQALSIWETLGNGNNLANTLNSLGVCAIMIGDYKEALSYFSKSLEIAHQIGVSRRLAFAQAGIGDAYLAGGAYQQALDAYVASNNYAVEAEVRALEVYNLVRQGECFFKLNNLLQAFQLVNQARDIAADHGLNFELGLTYALEARLYVAQGDYSASLSLFKQAHDCLVQNDKLEQAKVRLWWGYSLLLDMQTTAAFEQVQEAVKLTLGLGESMPGLISTLMDTKQLLIHFLHRAGTPPQTRQSIWTLLTQHWDRLSVSEPNLQLFIFGSPLLIIAGEQKHFTQRGGTNYTPEFLLYLVVASQQGGCQWTELCAALWPDESSTKASNRFHQHLKRLRNNILQGADYIIRQDDYYLINPHYLSWSDLLAFEALYRRASQLSATQALPLQLELIDLYQGELLAGFEVSEWGSAYRETCETRFLQTVKLASEQLLKTNQPQEARRVIDKGLSQDYFREDLHHNEFRAFAQLGLFQDLNDHYRELCTTFEREVGLPVDPVTAQLYEDLMMHR